MEYYVNSEAQVNGDHEVHTSVCKYLPDDGVYLGQFTNCADAVLAAQNHHDQVNGCYWCAAACHSG